MRKLIYRLRLKAALRMLPRQKPAEVVLDLGCGRGEFTEACSVEADSVGVDVLRSFKKALGKQLSFVVADVYSLPFQRRVADVVVCLSLLEHLLHLAAALEKIREVLKFGGWLIAGYPLETRLFKFALKTVRPRAFRYIDQTQNVFVNPKTERVECYWTHPLTHKQTYSVIRRELQRRFKILHVQTLPLNLLPWQLGIYELVKARNVKCN